MRYEILKPFRSQEKKRSKSEEVVLTVFKSSSLFATKREADAKDSVTDSSSSPITPNLSCLKLRYD